MSTVKYIRFYKLGRVIRFSVRNFSLAAQSLDVFYLFMHLFQASTPIYMDPHNTWEWELNRFPKLFTFTIQIHT